MNLTKFPLASLSFLVAALLSLAPAQAEAQTLEVRVEGVNQIGGQMLIGIFDRSDTFRTKPLAISPMLPVTEVGPIVTRVEGLSPGRYALAVIWDLNMNGELDTSGPFKIPREPFGFSNNPRALMGPPSFEECAFDLTEAGGAVTVVLQRR